MKRNSFCLFVAALTALFVGCSDEDGIKTGTPARPGDAIQFGLAQVQSRTAYVDRLQINWVKGDSIGIYSDKAITAAGAVGGYAEYRVDTLYSTENDKPVYHASLEAFTGSLKWGADAGTENEEDYTFWGAYPVSRIADRENAGKDGKFSMEYHTNQVCTVTSSYDGAYSTTPDMHNAYMMAKNTVKPTDSHVLMAFDPIMTTLDLTVTSGGYELATGIIRPVLVTGVSIIMPKNINSAAFDYTINDKTANDGKTHGALSTDRGDHTQSVFVGIKNGDKNYVELNEGESVNLMAFLPPLPQSELVGTKIKVHTVGDFDFVMTVPSDKIKLAEQSKIDIKMPKISIDSTKVNAWISKLDPATKVKTMSLPGYECASTDDAAKITDLLNKGVRVFDANIFMDGGLGITVNPKTMNAKIVSAFESFMKSNPEEFVIVLINNYSSVNNPGSLWIDWPSAGDNTTIADAKGKIVLLKNIGHGYGDIGNITNANAFRYDEPTSAISPSSTDTWQAHFYYSVAKTIGLKKYDYIGSKDYVPLYQNISNSTLQNGYTGIVIIPNAGKTYDTTYGDLLLQAVIDCNFKFRTTF